MKNGIYLSVFLYDFVSRKVLFHAETPPSAAAQRSKGRRGGCFAYGDKFYYS